VRSSLILCVLGVLLGVCETVYAAEPLRLVLRVASEADRALLPRLRGQLSDLDAALIVADTSPLEAAHSEQLDVARALATLHHADMVVWCASSSVERVVHIALPRRVRMLTRRFTGAAERTFSSDELETAAVLVRSALSMLERGVDVGTPLDEAPSDTEEAHAPDDGSRAPEQLSDADHPPANEARDAPRQERSDAQSPTANATRDAPEQPFSDAKSPEEPAYITTEELSDTQRARADDAPPQVSSEAPPQRDKGEPRSTAANTSPPSKPRARLALGAQLALDGASISGQRGLSARAGISLGRWALYAYGVYAFSSAIDDPHFALHITRHAAGVAIERELPLNDQFWLGVAVHAGALFLQRTSASISTNAVSYPAALMTVLALGPELALGWVPDRYGVSLRLGLDWLPNAPRFEVAAARVSHALWAFEPRITLAWEAALP
jgi:hypothetical protein